jgi:hypothetical protein
MRPFLVGLFGTWLLILTVLVVWPILAEAPWERPEATTGEDRFRVLLCEDALTRRRQSEQELARFERQRQMPVIIDVRRLNELVQEAKQDIERYCTPGGQTEGLP